MVNPPTVRGSAEPAGSRAQKLPARRDRRKIPVTRTGSTLPVVATWSESTLPGRSRSRLAVAAGTATGRAWPPPAALPGQVPATRVAWRAGSGSETTWIWGAPARDGGGDVQVVGVERAVDGERAGGQRMPQHGGHPGGIPGGGGRGTRRRGDQDAGGGAGGEGGPDRVAGHRGREGGQAGEQRGREAGG